MTAAIAVGRALDAGVTVGYRDPRSGCDVVVTTPDRDPGRWQEYLEGAERHYRSHRVEAALDLDRIRDGRSTSLLFVMLAEDGGTVGGIRVQGPYTTSRQPHAMIEWAGNPGRSALEMALARMVPEGLVELKAAWVADDRPARRDLAACLSRTPIHAAALLGARYAMGTAAAHSVRGWTAAGGVVDPNVPPVAYPDDRYRTHLVWWDRTALADTLTDAERHAVDDESAQLLAPVLPRQAR